MTSNDESRPEEGARPLALTVLGLRCAMAQAGGAQVFGAAAFQALEQIAPEGEADALYGLFFSFVRSLAASAERPLQWRRGFCAHLCRDEWLAVSMIDAGQRGDVSCLLGAAAELIGCEGLGDVVQAAQTLAFGLSRRGVHLQPQIAVDLGARRTLH